MIREGCGEGHDIDVTFRVEHSTLAYLLHFDTVLVSVLIAIYCKKETSLMEVVRCSNLRGLLATVSNKQHSRSSFSPKAYDLNSLCSGDQLTAADVRCK